MAEGTLGFWNRHLFPPVSKLPSYNHTSCDVIVQPWCVSSGGCRHFQPGASRGCKPTQQRSPGETLGSDTLAYRLRDQRQTGNHSGRIDRQKGACLVKVHRMRYGKTTIPMFKKLDSFLSRNRSPFLAIQSTSSSMLPQCSVQHVFTISR